MKHLVAIAGLVVLGGCVDATAPLVTKDMRSPAYTFVNGPATPGPIIRISDDPFFIFFDDDRSTHLAAIMRAGEPANLIPCGGSSNLDPADVQLVAHKDGVVNSLILGNDETVLLYDRATFIHAVNTIGLCGALATVAPIYTGTARVTSHDNDTFFSGGHTDAFGFSAIGSVVSVSTGDTYRYRNEYHGVLGADGSLLQFHSSITLSPVK